MEEVYYIAHTMKISIVPSILRGEKELKKKYKRFIICFIIEFCIISILNDFHVTFISIIGNAVAALLIFCPILIFLYLVSKDNEISEIKRFLSKTIFGFIIVSYIVGLLGKIVALVLK